MKPLNKLNTRITCAAGLLMASPACAALGGFDKAKTAATEVKDGAVFSRRRTSHNLPNLDRSNGICGEEAME